MTRREQVNVRRGFVRMTALTVVVAMPLLGTSGIASAKSAKATARAAAKCAKHPGRAKCQNKTPGGGTSTGGTGGAPANIEVSVSPNPLVETGQSEIHAVIQVETLPSFAGDVVGISSSQLVSSCETVSYESIRQGVLPPVTSPDSITTVLDDDGNATVIVDGINCAPGSSVVAADLESAPYYTALTDLLATPPNVTTPGLTGYPQNEVETGDTLTGLNGPSGNSDVYAVFYVEDAPVYAEQTVEIDSAQLDGRCGEGWLWAGGNGGTTVTGTGLNTQGEATTTLDDDGNAVFVFKGISCAAGDSQVIADVLAGTHDTFTFDYNILPPAPTI
jgi:hypothetical protein